MPPQRPSYILFDLGNVLVNIEPAAFLRTLGIDTPENRRYYQPLITQLVRRYERGEDSTETYLQLVDILFNESPEAGGHNHGGGWKFTSSEFRGAMLSIIRDPIAGMQERVARLAATVPLGLLSNTNPLHFDFCMEHLPALRSIPTHFLSYRMHALKPDRAIFEGVVRQLNLPPSEVLYFDDLADNVDAASSIGMRGLLFAGLAKLDQDLGDFGLI